MLALAVATGISRVYVGLSRILCKLHYRDSPLKGRLTLTVDADRSVPERKRRAGAAFDPSFGHGLSIYA